MLMLPTPAWPPHTSLYVTVRAPDPASSEVTLSQKIEFAAFTGPRLETPWPDPFAPLAAPIPPAPPGPAALFTKVELTTASDEPVPATRTPPPFPPLPPGKPPELG